jgi:hypothetical protein
MTGIGPAGKRAGMTSLVVHTAVVFSAVVTALWPTGAANPLAGQISLNSRPTMDVCLVQLHTEVAATPTIIEQPIAPPPPLPPAIATSPSRDAPIQQTAAGEAANLHSSGPPTPSEHIDREPLPAGTATLFCGVPAVGKSVVFLVDRSASMGLEGRLARAKREVTQSLERLRPDTRFQVIVYGKRAEPLANSGRPGLLAATPSAAANAAHALELVVAEGGTDHAQALRSALGLQPDVIYFLTDDDDLTFEQVREATRLNRSRAVIHALCFVEPGGSTAMPALARQNRGEFRVVK